MTRLPPAEIGRRRAICQARAGKCFDAKIRGCKALSVTCAKLRRPRWLQAIRFAADCPLRLWSDPNRFP